VDRFTAIKVFCAVVEHNGFAAAARHLRLSPAAVSKNIAELEAHLGARLLTRTTRRMSLSEAGSLYYAQASAILEQLDAADESVAGSTDAARGVLRVSAPMSFGLRVLAPLLPEFLDRHPDVTLDVELSDQAVDLIAGRFDLAIRGSGALPDSTLIAKRLLTLDRILCGAPSYLDRHGTPGHPDDLIGHYGLAYTLSGTGDTWTLIRGGVTTDAAFKPRLRVNNSLALRDAAMAGMGLALIPRLYVDDALADGRLIHILPDWKAGAQAIHAIYPAGRFHIGRLRLFLAFVSEKWAGLNG
jgi:DNA-binding transcriptional LysR family regulator